MSLDVAVVGHRSRHARAAALAAAYGGCLWLDDGDLGEWANHARALRWAADGFARHVLVLQDDAMPIPHLLDHLTAAITAHPDGPIGLYVGRVRPAARLVELAVRTAERVDASWLEYTTLLWGVATIYPVADLPELLAWCARHPQLPYDQRVGAHYHGRGVPVRYTWPSLVDHADGPPVITGRRRRREPGRVAWRVGAPPGWDGPVVQIR